MEELINNFPMWIGIAVFLIFIRAGVHKKNRIIRGTQITSMVLIAICGTLFLDSLRLSPILYRYFPNNPITNKEIESLRIEADEAIDNQLFDRAIQLYRNILKLDPQNVSSYIAIGRVYELQEKENYNTKLSWQENIDYNLVLNNGAIEAYGQALERDHDNRTALIRRAELFVYCKQMEEAVIDYTKLIEIYPEAIYYAKRAYAYKYLKRRESALDDLNKALELSPYEAEYYSFRADIHKSMRNFPKAISDYQMAIKEGSEKPYINYQRYVDLANCYKATNDYKAALNSLTSGIIYLGENQSIQSNLYRERGRVYQLCGSDKALEDYNKALELTPNSVNIYIDIGEYYKIVKDYSNAEHAFKTAILLDEQQISSFGLNGPSAYQELAEVYNEVGEESKAKLYYQKAIKMMEIWLKEYPYSFAYGIRAEMYEALGDQESINLAYADYEKAVEINPDDFDTRYKYAVFLYRQNQYERSIEEIDNCLQIEESNADCYNVKGVCYDELGRYSEAISQYNKAIEIDSYYYLPYWNRGQALEAIERYNEANQDYNTANEILAARNLKD